MNGQSISADGHVVDVERVGVGDVAEVIEAQLSADVDEFAVEGGGDVSGRADEGARGRELKCL